MKYLYVLLITFLLASCQALPVATSLPSPIAAPIVLPSPTSLPTPTSAPIPTPPPTPTPDSYEDASCAGLTLEKFAEDAEGRTILPKPSRSIFVSKWNGGRANTATEFYVTKLSEGVKLLRKGNPDALLFNRGEVFDGEIGIPSQVLGGASIQDLMVIGAYGAGVRPQINLKTSFLNSNQAFSNVAFVALDLRAVRVSNDFDGIRYVGTGGSNILIENVRVQGFTVNLDFDTQFPGATNIVLRRNQVLDAYAFGSGHSQGLYIDRAKGILFEDNYFDHNGWLTRDAGPSQATQFNHNLYIQTLNKCVTFRNNISVRASATGLQMRPGGVIENNFFYMNPIQLTYGSVNGGSVDEKHIPIGVSGRVVNNAMLRGMNMTPTQARDGSSEYSNISKALISGNLMAHHESGAAAGSGYILRSPMGIGIHNLLFSKNIAFDLNKKLAIQGDVWGPVQLKSDGAGGAEIWRVATKLLTAAQTGIASPPSPVTIADAGTVLESNIFETTMNDFLAKPTLVNTNVKFVNWQSAPQKFLDPMRAPGTFMNVGGDSFFFDHLRNTVYDPNFSAKTLNTYIKEGFTVK